MLPKTKPGYVLASTMVILFTLLASMTVAIQFVSTISSSTRDSLQSQGAIRSAASGFNVAVDCIENNSEILRTSATTPNSSCTDAYSSVNLTPGTDLTAETPFEFTA